MKHFGYSRFKKPLLPRLRSHEYSTPIEQFNDIYFSKFLPVRCGYRSTVLAEVNGKNYCLKLESPLSKNRVGRIDRLGFLFYGKFK